MNSPWAEEGCQVQPYLWQLGAGVRSCAAVPSLRVGMGDPVLGKAAMAAAMVALGAPSPVDSWSQHDCCVPWHQPALAPSHQGTRGGHEMVMQLLRVGLRTPQSCVMGDLCRYSVHSVAILVPPWPHKLR